MNYFDPLADEALLHGDVRSHPEIYNVLERAERDVFRRYTENGVVKLRGYDKDPEKADDDLVVAVKDAVANLASYRLRAYDNDPGVESVRQGNRSVTYRFDSLYNGYPRHWDSALIDFDERTVLYHV